MRSRSNHAPDSSASPSVLTFSSDYVVSFMNATALDSATCHQLLESAGISLESVSVLRARITHEQFSALYRNVAAYMDDEMPGLLSRPARGGVMKYAIMVMMTAPDIGTAIHRYTRISRLSTFDYALTLSRGETLSTLAVEPCVPAVPLKLMAVEIALKAFHGAASWLTGKALPLLRVDFAMPKPSYAGDMELLFPCAINYDMPKSRLVFESPLLDLKVKRSESEMRSFLKNQPRDWLQLPVNIRPASSAVWGYLMAHNPSTPTAAEISAALNISPRTLVRHLAEEGQSLREIKDALRRDLAIKHLTQSDAPIAQIAFDLGFEDTSSFYRAFRLWTGVTPGAYRES